MRRLPALVLLLLAVTAAPADAPVPETGAFKVAAERFVTAERLAGR